MNIGMLWFNNSDSMKLSDKIKQAAGYYQEKYGEYPNLCFMHPTMMIGVPVEVDGIELRATNSVLPNHFWLGVSSR